MKSQEVLKYFNAHHKQFLDEKVLNEFKNHTNKNIDYFYEPYDSKNENDKLIYIENDVLVIFEFNINNSNTIYIKLDSIYSIEKNSDFIIKIFYSNKELEIRLFSLNASIFKNEFIRFSDLIIQKYFKKH